MRNRMTIRVCDFIEMYNDALNRIDKIKNKEEKEMEYSNLFNYVIDMDRRTLMNLMSLCRFGRYVWVKDWSEEDE